MSNKTISINPNLFSIGGSKTKKNKKTQLKTNIPLISPNVLKNKLLNRIKEHKQRETQNLESNKQTADLIVNTEINNNNNNNIESFSDEFSNSINYLQTLSKHKKINDEKMIYDKQKQQRKTELERKTLRNYQSVQPFVNIELPEELKHMEIPINSPNISLRPLDPVPYGVLKGGEKPTYRDWNKTRRNDIVTNSNAALTIQDINNR